MNDKELLNKNATQNKSLYLWTDTLDGAHRLIQFILKEKQSKDVLSNLEEIRDSLFEYSKHDEERLKLIKIYLKTCLHNKDRKLYFSSISTILIGLITIMITKLIDGKAPEAIKLVFESLNPFVIIPALIIYAILFGLIGQKGDTRIRLIVNMIEEYEKK